MRLPEETNLMDKKVANILQELLLKLLLILEISFYLSRNMVIVRRKSIKKFHLRSHQRLLELVWRF
jgi:hypothetical protein